MGSYIKKINTYLGTKAEVTGIQYTAYGILGLITFPFFYLIWLFIDAQSYESIYLRGLCFGLCLLLTLHKKWPQRLKPFLPLYWYFTLLITIPFFFTFMLLMNHGSSIWTAANISSIFLTLLLVEAFTAVFLLTTGLMLGIFTALYLSPFDWLNSFDYTGFFITYLISIIIGVAFAHNRQVIEKLKQEAIKIKVDSEKERLEFLANINHDLRTPLSGLLSLSELEASTLTAEHPYKKTFTIIHQSAQQLHNLFESILQIAKLDYHDNSHEAIPFHIENILDNMIELFKPALDNKGLGCSLITPNNQPLPVMKGDPALIEHILINLISNAIKFTDNGRITISYELLKTVKTKNQQQPWLKFAITDTGLGISPEDQVIIFNAFKRLTPAYKNNCYTGTGLGLHAVKKMITLMEGKINVYSEGVGKGSTFTCLIPVEVLTNKETSPTIIQDNPTTTTETLTLLPSSNDNLSSTIETDDHEADNADNNPQRILLVEDNRIAMIAATRLFKQQPSINKIDQAWTMQQALELACQYHYDLIIMDIGLPDGDGKMATQSIRSIADSKNQHTMIVALTSHLDEQSQQECLTATMNRVLHKPLCTSKIAQLFEWYQAQVAVE